MTNLIWKELLYGLLSTVLAAGTCIGATGCTSDLAGKARVGFGVSNINEFYFLHDVQRNEEQTGKASASLDLQPLLDYLLEWKASQATTPEAPE